ncbi:hypothetical protein BN8_00539 [Fibrisoma limi BUZ 3]|uniref:Uncharacterized protein n=2 Tax=Fibrisoma limi TaxID=663275 RepID=I2GCH6_9BACT|nr:hypothetical protein BN8_00539 [Fibrisoma limi BUZ 3]
MINDKLPTTTYELQQTMANERFASSSFKDPLNRDIIEFNDKGVTFRVRKLIGGTDNFVFYSDISGVEIDNGLFFSTIRVIPRARPEIVIKNFTRGDARRVKELILQNVPNNRPDAFDTPRGGYPGR